MEKLTNILDKYYLSKKDKEFIINSFENIYNHFEFQKRMQNFPHHGKLSLGLHIIDVVVMTYKLGKKKLNSNDLNVALKIAAMHDLFTMPWQNNPLSANKKFFNRHGFAHPVEAVINSYTWFKEEYNDDADIIIDGIIHHMYPLPVIVINSDDNTRELYNFDLYQRLPKNIKELIKKSSNRNKFLNLSWCRSKYVTGKIVSKADKKVSFTQIKSFRSALALITGHNKELK